MDTIQLQSSLNITGVHSLWGCTLCDYHGIYDKALGKTVYPGARGSLDIDHIARTRGQSRQCCPSNHFNQYLPKKALKNKAEERITNYAKDFPQHSYYNARYDSQTIKSCDSAELRFLREDDSSSSNFTFICTPRDGLVYDWYKIFAGALLYPHCDYRMQKGI